MSLLQSEHGVWTLLHANMVSSLLLICQPVAALTQHELGVSGEAMRLHSREQGERNHTCTAFMRRCLAFERAVSSTLPDFLEGAGCFVSDVSETTGVPFVCCISASRSELHVEADWCLAHRVSGKATACASHTHGDCLLMTAKLREFRDL